MSTSRKSYARSSKADAEQKIKVASTREAKERARNKRKRDSDDSDTDSDSDTDKDSEDVSEKEDFQPSDSEDDDYDAKVTKKRGKTSQTDKWSGGETDSESDKSESDVEEEPYDSVLFTSSKERAESKKKQAKSNPNENARGRPKRNVTSILKTSLGSGDSDEDDDDVGKDDNDMQTEDDLNVETGIVTRRRLAKKAKMDSKIASLGADADDSPADVLESKRDSKGRIKYIHAGWTKQNALKLKRLIKETTSLYKSYTSCAIEWSSMQTWSPLESELKRKAKKAADFKQDYIDKRAELIQHLPFKAQRVYSELDICTENHRDLRRTLSITDGVVKALGERIVKLLEEKKQCIAQLTRIKKVKKTADTETDKNLAKELIKKYSKTATKSQLTAEAPVSNAVASTKSTVSSS